MFRNDGNVDINYILTIKIIRQYIHYMKDQEIHKIPFLLIFQFFVDLSRLDNEKDISEYFDIILLLVKRLNNANILSNDKEMLNLLYELVKINMNLPSS